MRVIHDASAKTLCGFVADTVEPSAIVHTDGWNGYVPLAKMGYEHRPRSQRAAKRAGDTEPVMPRAHRAISNFKSWLRGTHRGVSNEHLQVYLDEFTFRYNRRGTSMAAFQTLPASNRIRVPPPTVTSWRTVLPPRNETPEQTGYALPRLSVLRVAVIVGASYSD